MPTVHYKNEYGTHEINVDLGANLMTGAVQNGVDGILGECGGCCACATCHIYIDEAYLDKISPVGSLEEEMLECTESERRPNSRLGCQIEMTESLDGIVIEIPPAQ